MSLISAKSEKAKVSNEIKKILKGTKPKWGGVKIERYFTKEGVDPYHSVKWEKRSSVIQNEKGEVIFKQDNVEFPKFYSNTATGVIAQKYFRGQPSSPYREYSMRQLIDRVINTITGWGIKGGYFEDEISSGIFRDELKHILLYQMGSFNSPVWFNVGIEKKPQVSACFINSVEDRMESILELVKTEGMLFKYGSGTGTNFSTLRSSKETLSSGGKPSGPVSFMKGYDAFAGIIKSGGKTRRAAKMAILNVSHPDIIDFIECKAREENKARILIEAGYDGSFEGEAYESLLFQNANHSVRATDDFMNKVIEDGDWDTIAVTTGEIVDTYKARDIMKKIALAAHTCGDPGMQFDTTINAWHTCPNSGRINASNPCSEFMFIDNSACNLASLNLLSFIDEKRNAFDVEKFLHAVRIMIISQEIIVDNASYPTKEIDINSKIFRPLGLGYTNLGAFLMERGLPYDSDKGRAFSQVITALMTGQGWRVSGELAKKLGPFREFYKNREPMLKVIKKHRDALDRIDKKLVDTSLYERTINLWDEVLYISEKNGFRNAAVTLLAPTGTIGFMMDCDTTGIEPEIALVKYKKLVGGGMLKIVNKTLQRSLKNLGYSKEEIDEILKHIEKNDTIEDCPILREADLPVFDCAFKPLKGRRFISPMGHLKMVAAVQPFLSGSISKTVNLPSNVTVEDVMEIFIEAWKMGLKSIAIYRDGCKLQQPVIVKGGEEKKEIIKKPEYKPTRRKLPDERKSITHKFNIGGHEGYLTVGMYEDGSVGEIFVVMAKQGSVVSGLMDSFATAISLALQYGVPLSVLADKFTHTRFEPAGWTNNPSIPYAKSITDYIFRWLSLKFLPAKERVVEESEDYVKNLFENDKEDKKGISFISQQDSPPCPECGSIMVRSGSCYRCLNCGSTNGCS